MVRFGIPDIRLFWSKDERFLSQFDSSKPLDEMTFQVRLRNSVHACSERNDELCARSSSQHFLCLPQLLLMLWQQPFSKYPAVERDVTFWIPDDFSENTFADLVRSVAGDVAETVSMVGNSCCWVTRSWC